MISSRSAPLRRPALVAGFNSSGRDGLTAVRELGQMANFAYFNSFSKTCRKVRQDRNQAVFPDSRVTSSPNFRTISS